MTRGHSSTITQENVFAYDGLYNYGMPWSYLGTLMAKPLYPVEAFLPIQLYREFKLVQINFPGVKEGGKESAHCSAMPQDPDDCSTTGAEGTYPLLRRFRPLCGIEWLDEQLPLLIPGVRTHSRNWHLKLAPVAGVLMREAAKLCT